MWYILYSWKQNKFIIDKYIKSNINSFQSQICNGKDFNLGSFFTISEYLIQYPD